MNPNTNNQPNPTDLAQQGGMPQPQAQPQPQPQVMPQQMIPPQPVAAPIPQPVMPQMPQAPMPVQPQPQMAPVNPYVQPGATMPPMPAQVPVTQSANSSSFAKGGGGKKRKIFVAVGLLLAIAVLAGVAWFGFQKFANTSLKTSKYEGDGFSILYPAQGWKKDDSGSGSVKFTKDINGNFKSEIQVMTQKIGSSSDSEEEILKLVKDEVNKETIFSSSEEEVELVGDFYSEIEDRNGRKELIIKAKCKEKKIADCVLAGRAFIVNGKLYMAVIGVYKQAEKALYMNTDIILDSFSVK